MLLVEGALPRAYESGTQEVSHCSQSRWEDWKVSPQARAPVLALGLVGCPDEEQPSVAEGTVLHVEVENGTLSWVHRTCPDMPKHFRSRTRRPGSPLLRPERGLQNICGSILQLTQRGMNLAELPAESKEWSPVQCIDG